MYIMLPEIRRILIGLAEILPKDQYVKIKQELESMSEDHQKVLLANIDRMCKEKPSTKPMTAANYSKVVTELRKKFNVSYENSAMDEIPVLFLDEESNKELWQNIAKSKPSDTITLTEKEQADLADYFCKNITKDKEDQAIPSDIFFSQTVALLDTEIVMKFDSGENDTLFMRVVIFPDYRETVDKMSRDNDGTAEVVGAVIIDMDKMAENLNKVNLNVRKLALPILIVNGYDSVAMGEVGQIGFDVDRYNKLYAEGKNSNSAINMRSFITTQAEVLSFWYVIQILFLHPNKEVLITEKRTIVESKIPGKYAKAKNKKRKAKVIRKIYIHTNHLNDPIVVRHGDGIERKTLCWYVVGHWRTYKKSGKKIFIQPYWKGPLRETKQNLDLGRDREANSDEVESE